jgi:hypothetical protein
MIDDDDSGDDEYAEQYDEERATMTYTTADCIIRDIRRSKADRESLLTLLRTLLVEYVGPLAVQGGANTEIWRAIEDAKRGEVA